ncbi:MAG TPA: transporter [Methylomirabilota bacterium]|nr:transporter [Methylomirabilota bacterium]
MTQRLLVAVLTTAIVTALLPQPARAWDDPPGISFFYPLNTRRPVIEREFELTVDHEKGEGGRVTEAAATLEWAILPRWQVELKVPLVFLDEKDRTAQGGFGDIELETKVLVFDSIDPPALVAIGVEGKLPSGSERRGLGGEAAIEPFITAGVALGPFDLLASVSYEINLNSHVDGPHEHELTAGAALGWRVHRKFTPLVELTTVTQTRGDKEEGLLHKTQVYITPGFNVRPLPGMTFRMGVDLPVTDARKFDYAIRSGLVIEF